MDSLQKLRAQQEAFTTTMASLECADNDSRTGPSIHYRAAQNTYNALYPVGADDGSIYKASVSDRADLVPIKQDFCDGLQLSFCIGDLLKGGTGLHSDVLAYDFRTGMTNLQSLLSGPELYDTMVAKYPTTCHESWLVADRKLLHETHNEAVRLNDALLAVDANALADQSVSALKAWWIKNHVAFDSFSQGFDRIREEDVTDLWRDQISIARSTLQAYETMLHELSGHQGDGASFLKKEIHIADVGTLNYATLLSHDAFQEKLLFTIAISSDKTPATGQQYYAGERDFGDILLEQTGGSMESMRRNVDQLIGELAEPAKIFQAHNVARTRQKGGVPTADASNPDLRSPRKTPDQQV